MPSAEKSSSEAMKVEVQPSSEPKTSENAQKENTEQNNGEKNISPVQQVLQIIQNKVRNLEKRKNKLDGYMKEEEDGKELSSEQKKAVLKYEEVVSQLGISKEFSKQFQLIANQAAKEQKRLERKAAFLKQMQETTKVREVIIIQDLLRQLKNEVIRSDFLNATNGACLVNAAEMDVLERFSKHTIPVHPDFSNEPMFVNSAKTAADYLSFVVDGRNRQFLDSGFTFEAIKELFSRIQNCGYFEKDIKVVEVVQEEQVQEQPPASQTPQSNVDDLDVKDESNLMIMNETKDVPSVAAPQKQPSMMPTAPLPTQVPNPTQLFNGANVVPGMMPVMHAPPIQVIPQQMAGQMKTTVTAVENAFFNQMKYSQPQGPMNNTNTNNSNTNKTVNSNELPIAPTQVPSSQQKPTYIEDFASANISFLQDSLVEQQNHHHQQTGSQSPQQQQQQHQQKMPPNLLNQPKPVPIQQVHPQHPQQIQAPISQQMATHNFPPGLKLQQQQQQQQANIPVSYQQQLTQTQQVPLNSSMAPQPAQEKQQQQHYSKVVTNQHMPTNIQNLQDVEQKALNAHQTVIDVASDKPMSDISDRKMHAADKENHRSNEWNPVNNQQQPQIDTWQNDTAGGQAPQGNGSYNRFNRSGRGSGGPKYNNYRNNQGPRNSTYNENGNSDSVNREGGGGAGGSGTFFRNNERYNSGGGRGTYNNNMSDRGNFTKRENFRTGGSGRFSSSMGSSNPVQRK